MKKENLFIGMCFCGMTLIPSILSNVLDLELKFRIGLFIGFGLILWNLHKDYGGIAFLMAPIKLYQIPGNFSWTTIFVWGFIALITFSGAIWPEQLSEFFKSIQAPI